MNNNIDTSTASTTAPRGRPIRVLLADDHAVTLWGLRQLVDSTYPRMSVSGTVSTCSELLSHPALAETDVVLLDLSLRDASAMDCVPRLVGEAGVKVVILTGDLNPSHHRAAVLSGARGIVLKSQPTEAVLDAVERVHAGEVCFDGSLMSLLLDSLPGVPHASGGTKKDKQARRVDSLTAKEHQVVQVMVAHRGAKSLTVADALGMSEHTLRNHLTVIYSKLGVQGKVNLYFYAIEHGLVAAPHS
ncbi:MAG TPA: response regulator transcription factor [Albitalea sp.]|uniref:response regulator transcription factor n=1 Tax=Piscinibacter sp. TaxID=1903157 RepID=UPI002ED1CAAD